MGTLREHVKIWKLFDFLFSEVFIHLLRSLFFHGLHGKALETYRFNVKEAKILVQPAGAFFNRILDRNGELTDRFLSSGNIAVLDIGHNTLDMARFDKLDFIDGESESFSDLGLFEAYKDLSRKLKSTFGIEIRPAEVQQYARSGLMPFKGTMQSIVKETRSVYEAQAEKIVSRALNTWREPVIHPLPTC